MIFKRISDFFTLYWPIQSKESFITSKIHTTTTSLVNNSESHLNTLLKKTIQESETQNAALFPNTHKSFQEPIFTEAPSAQSEYSISSTDTDLFAIPKYDIDDAETSVYSDQVIITFPYLNHEDDSLETDYDENTPPPPVGLLLSGQLDNGYLNGIGKVVFPCGKMVHGHFVAGWMQGYSTVTLPDGSIRQGHFQNNVLHGDGRITLPSGHIIEGSFNQGKLVTQTP
jgi:hypothetical protein